MGRVATGQQTITQVATRAADDGIDPAFSRAILKIALELKKPNAPSYDDIVSRTIRSMRLDPSAFRRYLGENGARNMNLLRATARTMGPEGPPVSRAPARPTGVAGGNFAGGRP